MTAGVRVRAAHRGLRSLPLVVLALAMLVCGCATGVLVADESASSASSANCPAPSPRAPGAAESRLPVRSLCALPPEAGQVWRAIATGGRLAFAKDGATFQNAERRLPVRERGYYREYTIPTPGSRDRGARRFVTGGGREVFYTGDHYNSFVVVDTAAIGR